jgi:hypothetical protein
VRAAKVPVLAAGALQGFGIPSMDFDSWDSSDFSVLNVYAGTGTQNRTDDRKNGCGTSQSERLKLSGLCPDYTSFGVSVPLPKNRMGAMPREEFKGEPASELLAEYLLSLNDLVEKKGLVWGLWFMVS